MERLTENPTAQLRNPDGNILKALYFADVAKNAIDSTTKQAAASQNFWYHGDKLPVDQVKTVAPGVDSAAFPSGVRIPQDEFLPRARDVAIAPQLVNARRAPMGTQFIVESIAAEAVRVVGGAAIPVPAKAQNHIISLLQTDSTAIRASVEGGWFGQTDCAAYMTTSY